MEEFGDLNLSHECFNGWYLTRKNLDKNIPRQAEWNYR